ncbi:MAG: sensor histidine kinase [Gammaproteobacteria bacterium]
MELPNFCHMGVNLRIALTVEAALVAGVIARAADGAAFWAEFIDISALAQPALLLTLLSLCVAGQWLRRLPYRVGVTGALTLGVAVPVVTTLWLNPALTGAGAFPLVVALFSLVLGAGLLAYFNLRARALSPAITEARLQALQARIRPHFLFNSLNAVLSLVRTDPRRAEHALENMADLFRSLMSNANQLAPLEDEIALTRAYLELEQLRLGEDRLQVAWHIGKMPADALIPPLVIQPLVENAVYHGIEPQAEGGEISINVYRSADKVHVLVRNPIAAEASHHKGNRIALGNIRERLLLHFDLDAQLKLEPLGAVYQVHIVIPYTRERTQPAPARPHRR